VRSRVNDLSGEPETSAPSRGQGSGAAAIEIVPIRLHHAGGLLRAFDAVAREGRFLAALQAPPLDEVRQYVQEAIDAEDPMVVAIGDDAVVGWCDIRRDRRQTRQHRGALGVGVIAAWRGRGVGSRLLDAALRLARERGFARIDLDVHADNAAAIALYEKFGFAREGLQRDGALIDGHHVDVVLMARIEG
jgi:ribosomal protein S18 acetylase RimI-like enzyme